jgi:3-dehydroquinate synthase
MNILPQNFKISYSYPVYFIDTIFAPGQNNFQKIFSECGIADGSKFLFVLDSNVVKKNSTLIPSIQLFFRMHAYKLVCAPLIMPGGEVCKNDFSATQKILEAVNEHGIDRHSFIIAIGGGAVLDVVGFAAAIAHRGIRHIRIPTTVLSQNDSGVGVKNGINYFDKKNFIGTFAPPFLVVNDNAFLKTLSDRDYRSGIAEAIKVAIIKDEAFFDFIETNADKLNQRDDETISKLIYRCAELHMQHIASGDPFEQGNSRPLDFGHWSAHKLEQLTKFNMLHGEAVISGMCIDAIYANLIGIFAKDKMMRLINLAKKLNFKIYNPAMEFTDDSNESHLLAGLQEFREHLGGKLTIMLLKEIGTGFEVNEMNDEFILSAVQILKKLN